MTVLRQLDADERHEIPLLVADEVIAREDPALGRHEDPASSRLRSTIERSRARSEAVLELKRWGNHLGVRLPAAVVRAANLHVDQRVRVSVEHGRVVVAPLPERQMSLEARLKFFDPARHGGEAMRSQPLGAERW